MKYSHLLPLCGVLLLAGYAQGKSQHGFRKPVIGLETSRLQRRIAYPKDALKYGFSGSVFVRWFPAQHAGPEHVVISPGSSALLTDAVQRGLRAAYPKLPIGTSDNASVNEQRYEVIFRLDSIRGKRVGRVEVRQDLITGGTMAVPDAGGGRPPASSGTSTAMQYGPETDPNWDQADLQRRIVYPPMAQRNNIEGRVVVRALVNKTGQVTDIHVDSSDNPLLTPAAVDAIRGTHFTPATQNGTPVTVWVQIPIDFRLQ
ncbi:MAG: hypothetical protein JWQ98_2904 [Chlorobi bacterium]|nr:hypothetical protein [Chlorobiota bacterium]